MEGFQGRRLKDSKQDTKKRSKLNDVTHPNNYTVCWQIYTPG